ncbi:MAG TPA: efflux RND transporter periplasmic adaptor subunit [Candidatus Baltobacteraceae bacterium]|nr:efflux RND transporter periplasmic adaptor subunit [Candidatus Baltobacteraceae bacterium]
MNKRTRNVLIIVGGLAVLIAIAVFAGRSRGSGAIEVRTQKLVYAPFTVKLPENGVVMHERAATIPVLVSGNIGQMLVRAGSQVSQGELLATIYNPSIDYAAAGSSADAASANANVSAAQVQEQNARVGYQAQVNTNKSALDEAKRVYDADVTLYDNKAIPKNQLDADKAKLEQAQVAYDQAVQQLRLGVVSGYNGSSTQAAIAAAQKARIVNAQNQQQAGFLEVRAPFSGVIQSVTAQTNDALRPLQPGDQVTAGQPLFTMAGGRGYIVRAQVDEQDIINVTIGMPARVTGQDFPGRTINGHVAEIAPVATKSTDASSTAKQVLTTIALDQNPSYLRDGMSADVDILTTNIPHSIVVPNDAVFKEKNKSYVWAIVNGIAQKRAIVAGKVGDTTTLVKSGLAAGDTIVAQHTEELKEGAKVKPAPSASPLPSASGT